MSETVLTNAGAPANSLTLVTCDQKTILGNGTTERPLHTGSATSEFEAQFDNAFSDPNEPRVGNPVVVTTGAPSVGVAIVRTGSAGLGSPQLPFVVGILVEAGELGSSGGEVTVQTVGEVTLTTAQWDHVTGGSGGLTRSGVYYLDWGFNSFGKLTTVVPPTSGMAISQVGVALNPTTLLLSLPAVPKIAGGT